jgi:hypothetical protein
MRAANRKRKLGIKPSAPLKTGVSGQKQKAARSDYAQQSFPLTAIEKSREAALTQGAISTLGCSDVENLVGDHA